jgi:dolichol-phosphate mannosyltransferase
MLPMVDYSIVTATYNEAQNILPLLSAITGALASTQRRYEVLVVDDNSPDGTGKLVEEVAGKNENIRLLTRVRERGIGSAYLYGIRQSRGKVVCTMDADFSHPPASLPLLLAAAEAGPLVLGSRFLHRGDFDTLWYRALPTRTINFWHRCLLHTGLRDHTNGYIACRRDAMDRLLAEGERFGIRPFDRTLYGLILVALARRCHVPVKELRAKYVFRAQGETKIKFGTGVALFFEEWIDSLRLLPCRYSLLKP